MSENRELEIEICNKAMGWRRVRDMHDLDRKGVYAAQGDEIYIWDRGNIVKTFHPTTDAAAALEVWKAILKRYCVKTGTDFSGGYYAYQTSALGKIHETHAETFELMACRFAKALFEEGDGL